MALPPNGMIDRRAPPPPAGNVLFDKEDAVSTSNASSDDDISVLASVHGAPPDTPPLNAQLAKLYQR